MSKQKILIVDDDANIAELISLYLTRECYETRIAGDGNEALALWKDFQPDLILLDIMLPGRDGYQVCREIRQESDVPIMMLSARSTEYDKVLGLDSGADDYLAKPFGVMELLSRIRALLRRTADADSGETLSGGGIRLSAARHLVSVHENEISLTGKELVTKK